jgi:hypothetical protein
MTWFLISQLWNWLQILRYLSSQLVNESTKSYHERRSAYRKVKDCGQSLASSSGSSQKMYRCSVGLYSSQLIGKSRNFRKTHQGLIRLRYLIVQRDLSEDIAWPDVWPAHPLQESSTGLRCCNKQRKEMVYISFSQEFNQYLYQKHSCTWYAEEANPSHLLLRCGQPHCQHSFRVL